MSKIGIRLIIYNKPETAELIHNLAQVLSLQHLTPGFITCKMIDHKL